jgi:hypothetical protein
MNKVTVSLYGGLGNQLFQYATARSLAVHLQAELALDLAWFDIVTKMPDVTPRKFALAPFNIRGTLQNEGTALFTTGNRLQRLAKKIVRALRPQPTKVHLVTEEKSTFNPKIFSLQGLLWLKGHWSSPKYFENIQSLLQQEIGTPRQLNPKSTELISTISNSNAIAIHVRRGDYVTNKQAAKRHGLCGMEYYQAGLNIVTRGLDNPHCYIFSDDTEWVRENFKIEIPMTIVDVNGPDDAHQDLWLMAACKRFIIANSSLSWWGAWLCGATDKVVVSPKKWALSAGHDTQNLIPADWVQI